MKDESLWDYSECLIGHPCNECDDICKFKIITFRLDDKGADEKGKENERIAKESKGTTEPN